MNFIKKICLFFFTSIQYQLFCSSESSDFKNKYSIGDYAQGGIVFWLNDERDHGLVCSMRDICNSRKLPWSIRQDIIVSKKKCSPPTIFFNSYGIISTDGKESTIETVTLHKFLSNENKMYAASACLDYDDQGFSDWYLPSFHELCLIHSNLTLINQKIEEHGGIPLWPWFYWSSSDLDETIAWTAYMSHPMLPLIFSNKSDSHLVRAIRAF